MKPGKFFKTLNFLIPACYIAVGCIFMTPLFSGIDSMKRMIFGAIVILYGVLRMVRAFVKFRDRSC